MSTCDRLERGALEQFFYQELPPRESAQIEEHLRTCAVCRAHLADLHALSGALAETAGADTPPEGDWSGFMHRLELQTVSRPARRPRVVGIVRWAARMAAVLAVVVIGAAIALRVRPPARHVNTTAAAHPSPLAPHAGTGSRAALQAVTAEHLERSKVVVLDLAMRDPHTSPADWQDERRLAQSLLSDTRLYRLTAEEKGLTGVAHVMHDLETVLLEASMSDDKDPAALARVQRLIASRDLLVKMQVVSTATSSGT